MEQDIQPFTSDEQDEITKKRPSVKLVASPPLSSVVDKTPADAPVALAAPVTPLVSENVATSAPSAAPVAPEQSAFATIPPVRIRTTSRFAGWIDALKHVWAIYLATHLVFLVLSYLVALMIINPYAQPHAPLQTLLSFWNRWDTHHFLTIATQGYNQVNETAFFPLYPLLIHLVSSVVGSPLIAALLISNLAGLGVLLVFYRLVAADFGVERAERSVLYLAIFPTAFFLVAGYSESLFLLCALSAFYWMRRGRWWLAGLAMFFGVLTRSTGVVLVVPFAYEYLRQRDFQLRKMRLDVLSCGSVGLAVAGYAAYCYYRFHDFLAFSHAETTGWGRKMTWPGEPIFRAFNVIGHNALLNFFNMWNVILLCVVLTVLALLVLSFVGPWKFERRDWSYPLYGATVFLLCISLPVVIPSSSPLDSLDRYMLVIFPAIMVLAAMGKNRSFHLIYQALGFSLITFYALTFLMHRLLI